MLGKKEQLSERYVMMNPLFVKTYNTKIKEKRRLGYTANPGPAAP